MQASLLEQLKQRLDDHPHTVVTKESLKLADHIDTWTAQGSPYEWLDIPVENEAVQVFCDVGYGLHAVFVDGKLIEIFTNFTFVTHKRNVYMIINGPSYGQGDSAAIFQRIAS